MSSQNPHAVPDLPGSTDPLTVVCFLWKGWRALYGAQHVNALARMLGAHLRGSWRLLCVTDTPEGITECETMPSWDWPAVNMPPGAPNCYRRLRLFAPDAGAAFGPRILSIDLDCLLYRDITPLLTAHDFRIAKGYTCPYNGSLWLLKAGARPQLYSDFDPKYSPHEAATPRPPYGQIWLGSDQAWIAHKCPNEATWGPDEGIRMFHQLELKGWPEVAEPPRIMFFPGLTKPWDKRMQAEYPEIHAEYMQYYRSSATPH